MALVKFDGQNHLAMMGKNLIRLFPNYHVSYIDPFLFLDHFAIQKPGGFPDHPHRGFEIITYVLDGAVAHADSAGHESVIEKLGVQRVLAGRGIIHSEMPGTDGIDHGLQLWINLPRAEKKLDPEYQELRPNELPVEAIKGIRIRHLVGSDSPVAMRRPMSYQDLVWESDTEHVMGIPAGYQGFIYVLAGAGQLNSEQSAEKGDLFFLTGEDDAQKFRVTGEVGFRMVIAIGQPVGERPIFNGSFVD